MAFAVRVKYSDGFRRHYNVVFRSLGSRSPDYTRLTDERVRWTLISLFGSSTAKALKLSTGASVPDINMPTEDTSKKEFLSFIGKQSFSKPDDLGELF